MFVVIVDQEFVFQRIDYIVCIQVDMPVREGVATEDQRFVRMPVSQTLLITGDGNALILFHPGSRYLNRQPLPAFDHPFIGVTGMSKQAFRES